MCDSDSRLARIYSVDPALALKQAKEIWLSRAGISNITPPPQPTSGGHIKPGAGGEDLNALYEAAKNEKPGTKAYSEIVRRINAARKPG